jgi:hypothetical protein
MAAPIPNTIPVRIRIAVWPNGKWIAYGDGKNTEELHNVYLEDEPRGESVHWITADVPLPSVVAGTVEEEEAQS